MVLLACPLLFAQDAPAISEASNLRLWLSREPFGDSVVLGQEHKKNVSVASGAKSIMEACGTDSANWNVDQWWGRIAHSHMGSTFSCRQKSYPSLHFVGRMVGSDLKAEVHLDGNGPASGGRFFYHPNEFLYHKLFWKKNNQVTMRKNIQRVMHRDTHGPTHLTDHERSVSYLHETFGLGPFIGSATNSAFQYYLQDLVWKSSTNRSVLSRFQGALFTNTLENSLEFGIATWRHEDTRYSPSGKHGLAPRLKYAVVHAFLAKTPTGNELTYARLAALGGTTAVITTWHPWRENARNPYGQIAFGISDMISESLLAEFWPDISRIIKRTFKH